MKNLYVLGLLGRVIKASNVMNHAILSIVIAYSVINDCMQLYNQIRNFCDWTMSDYHIWPDILSCIPKNYNGLCVYLHIVAPESLIHVHTSNISYTGVFHTTKVSPIILDP